MVGCWQAHLWPSRHLLGSCWQPLQGAWMDRSCICKLLVDQSPFSLRSCWQPSACRVMISIPNVGQQPRGQNKVGLQHPQPCACCSKTSSPHGWAPGARLPAICVSVIVPTSTLLCLTALHSPCFRSRTSWWQTSSWHARSCMTCARTSRGRRQLLQGRPVRQEGSVRAQAPQGREQLLRAPRGPQGQGSQPSRVRGQGRTGGGSAAGQVGPCAAESAGLVPWPCRGGAADSAECEAWRWEGNWKQ